MSRTRVFIFPACPRTAPGPRLSHRPRMEDYGWPITSLLSLINEDNELPLLPTNYGSSAGTEQTECV